jgi:hypothetical protein
MQADDPPLPSPLVAEGNFQRMKNIPIVEKTNIVVP